MTSLAASEADARRGLVEFHKAVPWTTNVFRQHGLTDDYNVEIGFPCNDLAGVGYESGCNGDVRYDSLKRLAF